MAAKKKRAGKAKTRTAGKRPSADSAQTGTRTRLRRSDDDKIQLVRQVMQSSNQSAEIKSLGIYPNQFYDWKKRFAAQLGVAVGAGSTPGRKRSGASPISAARSVADEAKAFIQGKASLLERLRAQRVELDALITQMEA